MCFWILVVLPCCVHGWQLSPAATFQVQRGRRSNAMLQVRSTATSAFTICKVDRCHIVAKQVPMMNQCHSMSFNVIQCHSMSFTVSSLLILQGAEVGVRNWDWMSAVRSGLPQTSVPRRTLPRSSGRLVHPATKERLFDLSGMNDSSRINNHTYKHCVQFTLQWFLSLSLSVSLFSLPSLCRLCIKIVTMLQHAAIVGPWMYKACWHICVDSQKFDEANCWLNCHRHPRTLCLGSQISWEQWMLLGRKALFGHQLRPQIYRFKCLVKKTQTGYDGYDQENRSLYIFPHSPQILLQTCAGACYTWMYL